jgi:spermidine synthase
MQSASFKILLISILILFHELFFIRWISTEIRIFAYINNLVLLACFIGLGIGASLDKKIFGNILISFFFTGLIVFASTLEQFTQITNYLSPFSDQMIWYQATNFNTVSIVRGVFLTLFLFTLIVLSFIPYGQLLGSLFSGHENIIWAYSVNIVGSILGVWLFTAVSFLFLPPWCWYLLVAALGCFFIERKIGHIIVFFICFVFSLPPLIPPAKSFSTVWSPYQKLELVPVPMRDNSSIFLLYVNNVGYMTLLNMSEKFVNMLNRQLPATSRIEKKYSHYEIPYFLKKEIKDVLILGAGAGNDVAGAIRNDIKHIDAVEIDPGVYRIGSKYHPENPYSKESLHLYIDDARSFLKKTDKKYDLIVFGALDAHTSSSTFNNIQLDHYVYTKESLQEAKALLKADGILTLAFAAEPRHFITKRLFTIIKDVFGADPFFFKVDVSRLIGGGGIMFVAGNGNFDPISTIVDEGVKEFLKKNKLSKDSLNKDPCIEPTTDDWPYFYIKDRNIPKTYLLILIPLFFLLLVSLLNILKFRKKSDFDLCFFFLGAAFMLLEFQNISKASLVFGSTWIVNSYMISAILFLILLANWVIKLNFIKNIKWIYLALIVYLLILYSTPLSIFNSFDYLVKSIFVSIFMNIPIFFGGLVFMYSFNKCENKKMAYSSNLLGTSLGGLLQCSSFLFGVKSILLLVLMFYFSSYLCMKKEIIKI